MEASRHVASHLVPSSAHSPPAVMSAVREQPGDENRAGARGGGAGGREGGECLCGGVERERSHDTMNTQTSDGAGGVTRGQTISVSFSHQENIPVPRELREKYCQDLHTVT